MVFQQERRTFVELDDETGAKLAWEVNFDEANIGAGKLTGWGGV